MANPTKIKAKVNTVTRCGEGTYELVLSPLGRVPHYKAGQFLHLTVDEYDPAGGFWPESRVFSITSRHGTISLKIVYSVKGRYTKLMEDKLRPGLELWVKLPFGEFTIESRVHAGADAVLIAGGTGISPFIPYLEGLAEQTTALPRLRLYYGVRTPDQLLFSETLMRCFENGLIDLRVWIESDGYESMRLPTITPRQGRLNATIVFEECRELTKPDFFLSGPPAMISSFKAAFLSMGQSAEKIHIDEWE